MLQRVRKSNPDHYWCKASTLTSRPTLPPGFAVVQRTSSSLLLFCLKDLKTLFFVFLYHHLEISDLSNGPQKKVAVLEPSSEKGLGTCLGLGATA